MASAEVICISFECEGQSSFFTCPCAVGLLFDSSSQGSCARPHERQRNETQTCPFQKTPSEALVILLKFVLQI